MSHIDSLLGTTVAFDLDGTLVESAPDVIGAVNAVLIAEGFRPLDYAHARPFMSRGAKWLLQWGLTESLAKEPEKLTLELFGSFLSYYNAHIADKTKPFPGVVEALKALKERGAKLVVCTNKPTDLSISLLEKLEMMVWFDAVIGIDAVTAAKPNPTHLIEAIRAVDGDIGRAVMVGDAEPDAKAANGAGVPLVLANFGYSEIPPSELSPDALIFHFEELENACLSLLKGKGEPINLGNPLCSSPT